MSWWLVGAEGMENHCLTGTDFQFSKMRRFLWRDGGDSNTIM